MVSRIRAERFCSPNPGSSISMVPMRANTSIKAAAKAGRKETSIRTVTPLSRHCEEPRRGDEAIQSRCARPLDCFASLAMTILPLGKRSAAGDMRGDAQEIAVQRVGHERQRQQQRDEDRQDLRNE